MVLLFTSVVFVPSVGELYREFALPLISVDLVPRVGGFGHQNFFRTTLGTNEGALLGQPRSSGTETSLKSRAWAQAHCLQAVGSGAAAQTLVPCVETAT